MKIVKTLNIRHIVKFQSSVLVTWVTPDTKIITIEIKLIFQENIFKTRTTGLLETPCSQVQETLEN